MPSRRRLLATTLLAVFVLLVGISPGATQPPDDLVVPRTQLWGAIVAQERHTNSLLQNTDVVGTAIGVDARGQGVIKIYVRRAGVRGVPATLDGIRVVVEVTGDLIAFAPPASIDRTARFARPVPIGVSTGHPQVSAGTIGCRVTDGANVYALSNNHVYAIENRASIGDNALQPGPSDGGVNPDDAIGTLHDFQPIDFSPSASNQIDAAISLASTATLGNATPPDGFGMPRSQTLPASVGLRVMKYGRTTGLTKGRIDAINAIIYVNYDSGVAQFVNQIVIKPGTFSAGGDSGSLVVAQSGTNARKPVGLVFAGSGVISIANPIGPVLERFGVTIDGQ
jgi:Peptidase family S64